MKNQIVCFRESFFDPRFHVIMPKEVYKFVGGEGISTVFTGERMYMHEACQHFCSNVDVP